MIKFDSEKMELQFHEFKKYLANFFDNSQIDELLDNNNFLEIYHRWTKYYVPQVLSAFLLLAIPEHIAYLDTIPKSYFNQLPITEITIPKNILVIRENAFMYCTDLKKVFIEDGCRQIHEFAFSNCVELREVSLPSSIEFLGADIFRKCGRLDEIEFRGTRKQWAKIKLHYHWDSESGIKRIKFSDGTVQEI